MLIKSSASPQFDANNEPESKYSVSKDSSLFSDKRVLKA